MLWTIVLVVQCATLVILGVRFLAIGDWRLGVAQLLLSAVTAVLYSAGLS